MPYPYDEGPDRQIDASCIGPFSRGVTLGANTKESSLTEGSLDILDKELLSISEKIVSLRNKLSIVTTSKDNDAPVAGRAWEDFDGTPQKTEAQTITPRTTLHSRLIDSYNRAVNISRSLQSLINSIQL
jgi:hypothetical protein